MRVRFRVDGVLCEVLELPPGARRAVLSRIKVMAGMDIAVRRRPQDGAIPLERDGRSLTLRFFTLPVESGEKAVVRVLDPREAPAELDALGLRPGRPRARPLGSARRPGGAASRRADGERQE